MSNDNDLSITRFFSPVIISSNSSMTSSQSATGEEVLSPSYINAPVGVPPSSTILPASSSLEAPVPPPSLVSTHEGGYKHPDITVELSTISPESIISTNGKTFVKTVDLAYFSRLKKYSKVWDHGTQLLEVQSKKKYWLCDNCMFFP